ncbi:MAG: hypothetical protein WBD27_13120 [Pyrinomonadaceae bacterium]
MSKTQLDRLGDRIRKSVISDDDLRLLDEYRLSFAGAYENVVGSIQENLSLDPTGRPSKSTTSISDKLRRESIRLSQIQDIAGCRLVVADVSEQDSVVASLRDLFGMSVSIVDRRERPSHGYRAVHMIVQSEGKLIEVQVRTSLQHLWAELSEKLSDVSDPSVKYGGGSDDVKDILANTSGWVAEVELREATFTALIVQIEDLTAQLNVIEEKVHGTEKLGMGIEDTMSKMNETKNKLENLGQTIDILRETIFNALRKAIEGVERLKD